MLLGVCKLGILLELLFHAFTLGLTVIVVAVPEGLPMMIAVVLSANIRRMIKDNVLVRKPVGIEAAGSMNILFTDKTGTLTQNRMKVTTLVSVGKDLERNEEKQRFILTLFALCNDARREGTRIIAEPTEKALADAHDNSPQQNGCFLPHT